MINTARITIAGFFLFWTVFLFAGYGLVDAVGDTLVGWTDAHGISWFFHALQSLGLFVVGFIWFIGTFFMVVIWVAIGKARAFESVLQRQQQSSSQANTTAPSDITLTQGDDGVYR